MAVRHAIDERQRRVMLLFGPEDGGREAARVVCHLICTRPELTGFDFLYDLSDWSGESSNADMETIADCYRPRSTDDGCVKHTVFVTRDENFVFWAMAMDHIFPDRRHHVARTVAAAHARLDALRAG